MHLFVSAGEPSGDLHGANLVTLLRQQNRQLRVTGFGGEQLAAAGIEQLYPLTELAVMGISRVIAKLPTFFHLARRAEVHFRTQRPDAVIIIDYPGFHWALAKRAHRVGIPVYYFVPPQLWAWAGWRVKKMQRWVDACLTTLPFEDEWYRQRGVETHYVGHPYFDELHERKLRDDILASYPKDKPIVGLLPGSRNQEIVTNFPLIAAAAARVRRAYPEVTFLVAGYREKHRRTLREMLKAANLEANLRIGETPEIIASAHSTISVSGSVGLELLYHGTPSAIVYKIAPFSRWVSRKFITCPYISLVNLLAERELFPEFLTTRFDPDEIAKPVIDWLRNPEHHAQRVKELEQLRDRVAQPGACQRAADTILKLVTE